MTKWQYKRVSGYFSEVGIETLGQAGWELVSVVNTEGSLSNHHYFFKRPIEAKPIPVAENGDRRGH